MAGTLTRRLFLQVVGTLWYFIRGDIAHPILMPTVTITHANGTTETISQTVGWTWKREIGEMEKVTIRVLRDDAQAVTLTKKSDEIELSGVKTGRLVDINKGGSTWDLIVYSFEWDANRHAPTSGGDLRTDTDKALIDTLINSVSEWTIGTTNALTGQLTFVFNHALAHEAMRRIEKNTPGELRFNSDKSVDYVSRLGSDKSASITLSPSNANVDGDIKVSDRGRTMDATHVRLIGAHEGEAQVFANLVPTSDGATYENRVNYSQPRWSSSDDTDWARWANKDVTDQNTIDEEAAALADELTDEHIEVKATVVGEDLALGDTVHVTKPEADIDRDMRIQRIITRADGPTTKDECLLSTRSLARDSENERIRDIQRFNVAFQGDAVTINSSGGRQAVNADNNYLDRVYYPGEVEFEHRLNARIMALPYRSFHKQTQFHSHKNNLNPEVNEDVYTSNTVTDSSYAIVHQRDTDFFSSDAAFAHLVTLFFYVGSGTYGFNTRLSLFDSSGSSLGQYPDSIGFHAEAHTSPHTVQFVVTNPNVDEIAVGIKGDSGGVTMNTALHMQALPPHNHLAKPGADEEFSPKFEKENSSWTGGATRSILPMNPDLLVNGSKVAGGEDVVAVDPSGIGDVYQGIGTPMEIGQNTATVTIASDYPLEIIALNGSEEGSYTTSSKVDLSGHDTLTVDVRENFIESGAPSQANRPPPGSYLIVGNNKGDDHTQFVRRVEIPEDFTAFDTHTYTMDVSDLTGSYYIRFHTVGFTDGSGNDYRCDSALGHILLDPIFGELGETADEFAVDIRNELTAGQVNTIEVTSSQPGNYQVWVEGDTYRQILGNG